MANVNVPYNSEAEAALLGNLLQYKTAIQECLDLNLSSDDFFVEKHKYIYQTILMLADKDETGDIITFLDRLQSLNLLEKSGGKDYILSLVQSSVSISYTSQYVKLIKSKSLLRQITNAAEEIKINGQDTTATIDDILEKAKSRIDEISNNRPVEAIVDGKVVFDNTLKKIKQLKDLGADKYTGVRTQFDELDKITTGFQNGDFIILAARPSVGKTALALNMALNAASTVPGAVAFFSLEMSALQIGMRMVSISSGCSLQDIRTGRINDTDQTKIMDAIDRLKKKKIFIDESSVLKVRDIHAKCRNLKKQAGGLSIVFIDYIGLIDGSGSEENRQQEVSRISREIKAMARDLDVPVVALSQLRRLPEQTKTKGENGTITRVSDRKPRASDLRESGALEQDADLVLLIHRPQYSDTSNDDQNGDGAGNYNKEEEVDLIVAKHRNGPSQMEIKLKFHPNTTSYVSFSE